MTFRTLKYYFEIDELTSMKLKSLIGKSNFNSKDFQNIISALITKTYETQKGKPIK